MDIFNDKASVPDTDDEDGGLAMSDIAVPKDGSPAPDEKSGALPSEDDDLNFDEPFYNNSNHASICFTRGIVWTKERLDSKGFEIFFRIEEPDIPLKLTFYRSKKTFIALDSDGTQVIENSINDGDTFSDYSIYWSGCSAFIALYISNPEPGMNRSYVYKIKLFHNYIPNDDYLAKYNTNASFLYNINAIITIHYAETYGDRTYLVYTVSNSDLVYIIDDQTNDPISFSNISSPKLFFSDGSAYLRYTEADSVTGKKFICVFNIRQLRLEARIEENALFTPYEKNVTEDDKSEYPF